MRTQPSFPMSTAGAQAVNCARSEWSGCFPCCSPIRVHDGGTVRRAGSTRISPLETYVETNLEETLVSRYS